MVDIDFPDPASAPADRDLIAICRTTMDGQEVVVNGAWPKQTVAGSTWAPDVIMAAYRIGLFPMPLDVDGITNGIGWWSPAQRALFMPGGLRVTRSLAASMKKFRFTSDTCFVDVVRACGDPRRPQGWIDDNVVSAFGHMHELGVAHSIEVWCGDDLVGGLYGVDIGGIFAGESMFHRATDASKAALVKLAQLAGDRIIDTQWLTDHLASLGAVEVDRSDYLNLLALRRDELPITWPKGVL